MHSSRMRTARLLTASRSIRWRGGACMPEEGVHGGGCVPRGDVHAQGVCMPCTPPWREWQMLVKILPCPKLRLRAVIRMYSSRMHTICCSNHLHGGGCLPRSVFPGVCVSSWGWRGVCPGGCLHWGCLPGGCLPRIIDRCKNITFPQLCGW